MMVGDGWAANAFPRLEAFLPLGSEKSFDLVARRWCRNVFDWLTDDVRAGGQPAPALLARVGTVTANLS
jgi:hypothetical protein